MYSKFFQENLRKRDPSTNHIGKLETLLESNWIDSVQDMHYWRALVDPTCTSGFQKPQTVTEVGSLARDFIVCTVHLM